MRSPVLSILSRSIPRSYSTMAQISKVPAQEFLNFVNASPTRMSSFLELVDRGADWV